MISQSLRMLGNQRAAKCPQPDHHRESEKKKSGKITTTCFLIFKIFMQEIICLKYTNHKLWTTLLVQKKRSVRKMYMVNVKITKTQKEIFVKAVNNLFMKLRKNQERMVSWSPKCHPWIPLTLVFLRVMRKRRGVRTKNRKTAKGKLTVTSGPDSTVV